MDFKKIVCSTLALMVIGTFASCKKDDVAIKIDTDKMTIKEFENYYYTQNKMLLDMSREELDKMAADPEIVQTVPTLNKKMFMEQLLALKLIERKLNEKEKAMNKDEKNQFNTIMDLVKLQAYSMYYVTEKLKDTILISSKEIEKYYFAHPELSNRLPLNKIVEAQIKAQLIQDKAKEQGISPNTFVGDLIAEYKINKEGFENYLKKEFEKNEALAKTAEESDGKEKKDEKIPQKTK